MQNLTKPTNMDFAVFFLDDDILGQKLDGQWILPLHQVYQHGSVNLAGHLYYYLGEWQGARLFAIALPEKIIEKTQQLQRLPIRQVLEGTDQALSLLLCRGKQLLYWHQHSQFCGTCGSLMEHSKVEIAKICQNCPITLYPSYAPAIIVAIEHADNILLARSAHFTPGIYSTLAGFLAPGESAEQALHREVQEEVGITIQHIQYFGSQMWPFQTSLMLAYQAQYASGKLHIDYNELEDARWFNVKALPLLPSKTSIARHLIDDFIRQMETTR